MLLVPVTGLCVAATVVPYDVVNPYSNVTDVEALFAFTDPFNVAVVVVTLVAAFDVAVGAATTAIVGLTVIVWLSAVTCALPVPTDPLFVYLAVAMPLIKFVVDESDPSAALPNEEENVDKPERLPEAVVPPELNERMSAVSKVVSLVEIVLRPGTILSFRYTVAVIVAALLLRSEPPGPVFTPHQLLLAVTLPPSARTTFPFVFAVFPLNREKLTVVVADEPL